ERQSLHGCEVQALVERARRRPAIADVHESDTGFPAHLERHGDPGHHGDHVPKMRNLPRYPFSRSLKWTLSSRPRVGLSALAMYCRRISTGWAPITRSEPRLRIRGERMSLLRPRSSA